MKPFSKGEKDEHEAVVGGASFIVADASDAYAYDYGQENIIYRLDAAGDTVLRVHWANQATGLVADEVAELMFKPALWGDIAFK